jgi:membrane protein implicated in regulation of membrane protease activity
MTTVIGAILAFLFLDPPWRYLLIVLLLLIDCFQIVVWLRWRNRRAVTGHKERLIGAKGETLSDCKPFGQVRVLGQVWKAYCPGGVEVGMPIVVKHVDGLQLEIVPAPQATASRST